jgi:hypothetical protein
VSYPLEFKYRNYMPFDSPLHLAFRRSNDGPIILWSVGALFQPVGEKGEFAMFCENKSHGMVALIFERMECLEIPMPW